MKRGMMRVKGQVSVIDPFKGAVFSQTVDMAVATSLMIERTPQADSFDYRLAPAQR